MDVVMKRRVIGAAVLVGAGVLVPIMLVKLAKPSAPPSGESVRVYEITRGGDAQPTGETKPKQPTASAAKKPDAGAQQPTAAQSQPETNRETKPKTLSEPTAETPPEAVAPQAKAAQAKPPPAPKPAPKPKANPKPAPKAESSSGAPAPATAQKPYFAVQIGSFGEKQNAVALTQKLKRDFPVYYRVGQLNGKPLYRVRVGPFDSREAAEVVATRLREQGVKTQTMSLP